MKYFSVSLGFVPIDGSARTVILPRACLISVESKALAHRPPVDATAARSVSIWMRVVPGHT
jgi:hypothetical protein